MVTSVKRPSPGDLNAVFNLIKRSDIAAFGEADTELSDLEHEWGQLDLDHDAWLIRNAHGSIIGYASVLPESDEFRLDIYVDPKEADRDLTRALLGHCENRVLELAKHGSIACHTYLAQVHQRDQRTFQDAGFTFVKSYFQMHIDLATDLEQPSWPEGISVRTAIPKEDDRVIYQTVQAAFERSLDEAPTFEEWRAHMIRPKLYDPELWFLALADGRIIGTCLGIKYETEGWIRQFGVLPEWRRQGIASALLRHAFLAFRSLGYTRAGLGMEANNTRALQFYERLGMQVLRQYDEFRKQYP